MNKKILSILVLTLVISFSTTAFASLTFTTDAITGTSASAIDLGAGNALSIQTTGNGAITTGTGLVTLGGSLSVTDSITLPLTTDATTGIIFKGADRFMHDFTLTGTNGMSTFLGINAGNFTMTGSAGVYGSYNTGVGYNVLNLNTTGNGIVGIGDRTLQVNTTGEQNTAIGSAVLMSNTTGSQNTAIGKSVLLLNTTGSKNTAIGASALFSNSTGSSNVVLGSYAGYYETGSNSFYVNNIKQSNTANDKAYSLLYGTFSGTAGSLTGQKLTVNALFNINLTKLSVYANNAAAITGGLVAGDLYRTGADPDPIMVVH